MCETEDGRSHSALWYRCDWMPRVGCALALLLTACGTVGYEVTADSDAADAETGVVSDAQPACSAADNILCEDFEADFSRWLELPGEGRLTLETREDRPGQVLHVSHPGLSATMLQYALPVFDTLYARSWIRVASGEDLGEWAVFMEVRQDPHREEKISFDGVSDNRLQVVSTADKRGIGVRGDAGSLPRGEWFCAEFFIVLGNPGVAWVQANGTRVELPSDINLTASEGRFDTFLLGIATSGITLEASFDDVVISSTDQGCGL